MAVQVEQARVDALSISPSTVQVTAGASPSPSYANPEDILGSRCDPEDDIWPCPFELLSEAGIRRRLEELAGPETFAFDAKRGWRADAVSFQPCLYAKSQDRHVAKRLKVLEKEWTVTGVFDGHLGDATAEHAAYHIPIMIQEHLVDAFKSLGSGDGSYLPSGAVAEILRRCLASFDEAIAADVINLFPGGVENLAKMPDRKIREVVNDPQSENLQKARLCMHGTTVLVALVDPAHENLWVANLGDSQAVLLSPYISASSPSGYRAELLTSKHNGENDAEIQRMLKEHPEEPAAVADGRVLGVLAPFRSIGDVPFKQPPEFTRKILYNLGPGGLPAEATRRWEDFLQHNQTPPYVSAEAEVIHRRLSPIPERSGFLLLCSDGLTDLYAGQDEAQVAQALAANIASVSTSEMGANIALSVLRLAIGGHNWRTASAMLTLETDIPWMDDTTIIVQTL